MKRIAVVAVLTLVLVFGAAGVSDAQNADFGIQMWVGDLYGFYSGWGSDACSLGACHADIYTSWQASPHAFAGEADATIAALTSGRPNCQSCHSTNFEPANTVISDLRSDLPEATELGQGCEACHGPGHYTGLGGQADVSDVRQSQTCGSCHNRHAVNRPGPPVPSGLSIDVEYPVGFVPDAELHQFVNIPSPEGFPGFRDEPSYPEGFLPEYFWTDYPSWSTYAHGGSGVQYQEFRQSAHGLIGMECVTCHTVHGPGVPSGDFAAADDPDVPGVAGTPMLKKASFALCADCHRGSNLQVGSIPRNPQASMLQGTGALGIANQASPHSPFCTECHMVATGFTHSGNLGEAGNHLWQIVTPQTADTLSTTVDAVVVYTEPGSNPAVEVEVEQEVVVNMGMSSCSPCHGQPAGELTVPVDGVVDGQGNPVSGTVDLGAKGLRTPALSHGAVLEQRQAEITAEITALRQLLTATNVDLTPSELDVWRQAKYNVDFVAADGSGGFHNYGYAVQALFQARDWLETLQGGEVPVGFPDVKPGDYFYEPVLELAAMGVVSGYPDGSFGPYNNVLRAQFAKMIVGLMGLHTPTIDNSSDPTFTDVTTIGAYPYDYVEEAAAQGLVSGFDDGTFRPFTPIARVQIATILYRAAGGPDVTAVEVPFTDLAGLSAESRDAVAYAYDNGLVNGYPDGTFKPFQNALRGQVAKMLWNFYQVEGPF